MENLLFVNKSNNPNPEYAKEGDSGFDLRAWITEEETDKTFSFLSEKKCTMYCSSTFTKKINSYRFVF